MCSGRRVCEKMCSGNRSVRKCVRGRLAVRRRVRGGFAVIKCVREGVALTKRIPGGMALRERVPGRCSGNIDSKLKSNMQSTMKMSVELPAVASCHFKRGRPILLYDRICVRPVSFICLAIAIVLLLYVIGCNS